MSPKIWSSMLAILAGALLAIGGTLGYVRAEIADQRAFSERLVSALDDPAVRGVVADRTVDALVEASAGDLLTVRPVVTAAIEGLVSTPPFRRVGALAVGDVHRELVSGDTSLLIELRRGLPLFAQSLRALSSEAGAAGPARGPVVVAELGEGEAELGAARRLVALARWWWLILGAALAAAAVALMISRERRRTLGAVGGAVAVAGAAVAAAVTIGGAAAAAHLGTVAGLADDRAADAVAGLWSALLGDLRDAALIIGASGLLVAAVAAGVARPLGSVDRAAAWVRARDLPPWLSSGALLVAGLACLLVPGAVLEVVVFAAGAALLYLGASGFAGQAAAGHELGSATSRRGLLIGASLVVALAACTVAALIALDPPELPAAVPSSRAAIACNGSAVLCDRRLDEVVFAATHNSYAAADEPGWLFANQRFAISRQLDDGIRGLLIDVHSGVRDEGSGRVRTDIEADGTSRNKIAQELSPEALRTADRIAGRVGAGTLVGTRRPFLCHGLCELGAELLDQELAVIRRFLEREPNEVIVAVVEDYVEPEVIERSLRRTRLLDYAATIDFGAPLPTLGELIGSEQRLVLFAEQEGGTRPWYPRAFDQIQDTPLGATRPSELRCTRFRGTDRSPILQLNHWIDNFPPRPSDHEAINQRAFLERRIERCAAERGLPVAMLAVDFYERSDVIEVAGAINTRRP